MYHMMKAVLEFDTMYIADPYWPEREELINIQKESGMNRARSEQKRQQALANHLTRIGWDADQYQALEALATRPWYRQDGERSPILIPAHHMYGCLIEACKSVSSSLKPCDANNLRFVLKVSDFVTEKVASDGNYKRLVMPKSGTGQPLSNQRALRINPYIKDFHAQGTIAYMDDQVAHSGDSIADFLAWAGQYIGVGASRKMGCGRFRVTQYEASEPVTLAGKGRR